MPVHEPVGKGSPGIGISSLEFSCQLGVKYGITRLLHNKILRAMTEWVETSVLRGQGPDG